MIFDDCSTIYGLIKWTVKCLYSTVENSSHSDSVKFRKVFHAYKEQLPIQIQWEYLTFDIHMYILYTINASIVYGSII